MRLPHIRASKEAVALTVAVGVVATSTILGQRSGEAEAVAATPTRTTVAVVNSSDPAGAVAAWTAVPAPDTATALVTGPSSAVGCGMQEVSLADAGAVARMIKNAQLAGVIPELDGIPVTIAPTTPVEPSIAQAWGSYLAAAGASTVVWLPAPATTTTA